MALSMLGMADWYQDSTSDPQTDASELSEAGSVTPKLQELMPVTPAVA